MLVITLGEVSLCYFKYMELPFSLICQQMTELFMESRQRLEISKYGEGTTDCVGGGLPSSVHTVCTTVCMRSNTFVTTYEADI